MADVSFLLENMPFNIFYRCLHMRIDHLVDIFRLGLNFYLIGIMLQDENVHEIKFRDLAHGR